MSGIGRIPEHLVFDFELTSETKLPAAVMDVRAHFRLFVGSEVLYEDANLPILELAEQLRAWCDSVADTGASFSYDSRESVLPGVVRIAAGAEGWHVSSVYREFASPASFGLAEVVEAARDFLDRVEAAQDEYGAP